MSKIFNVVRDSNLLDFDEACESEQVEVANVSTTTAADAVSLRPAAKFDHVVRLRVSDASPVFPFDAAHQKAAEQYRIVRTKLLHDPKKPALLVISSSGSGDGKTVTTINLAATFALKQNAQVLLVDGDLRRPRIADMLGIAETPGLAEVLAGTSDLDSALVQAAEFPNLFVLPAGIARGAAAELLESQNWRTFITQIRARFTTVLFDAPPIALVADYELIQLACDAAIVVVRPDHSSRTACLKALEIVPRDKLIGVLVNCFESWWLRKTNNYSYY